MGSHHTRHVVSVERRGVVVSASLGQSRHVAGQGGAEAPTVQAAARRSPDTWRFEVDGKRGGKRTKQKIANVCLRRQTMVRGRGGGAGMVGVEMVVVGKVE